MAYFTRIYGYQVTHTSDEAYWMQRTVQFGAALARGDPVMTYRSGHPGVTIMWIGLIGIGPQRLERYLPQRFASFTALERDSRYLAAFANARLAVILSASVLVATVVGLAWRLLGREAGLLGGMLLLLDAYTIGMTRLLHVDALLAPLMGVSALAGMIWWRHGGRGYLVLSAVAGGIALLTKAPAAYLPIFFGVAGLFLGRHWRSPGRWIRGIVIWASIAALVYVLLWPAMWVDPVGVATRVIGFVVREGGQPHNWSNFFLGEHVTDAPGPLFYPVALLFRLNPIVVGGVAIALVGGWRRPADRLALVCLAGCALGFMVLMTLGGKKFDRYMLPSIIMLDLLAGVGLWMLLRRLRPVQLRRTIAVAVIALQAALLWNTQPYPIAYYNPLLGGAGGAERTLMLGWGEGLEQVAGYLNRQRDADRQVASTLYHHALRPLFRGRTQRIVAPLSPDYFVVYVNMAQRHLIPEGIEDLLRDREPAFTTWVNGVAYAHVYRLPPGVPISAPGQAPVVLPTDEEPDIQDGDE